MTMTCVEHDSEHDSECDSEGDYTDLYPFPVYMRDENRNGEESDV